MFRALIKAIHRYRVFLWIVVIVTVLTVVFRQRVTSHSTHGSIQTKAYISQATRHLSQNKVVEFTVTTEDNVERESHPLPMLRNVSFPTLNQTKLLQQVKIKKLSCGGTKSFDSLTIWQKNWVLKHLIVDDKYRLLYCYVPKVGCANWKRVFSVLYGDATDTDDIKSVNHSSMKLLASYPPHEVRYRLHTYFKFMFVRHPLDRLLSAYRNKFGEHFAEFERDYGVYIVKHFRSNPPEDPKGNDVTFSEFLAYVSQTPKERMNEHWSRYVDLCQPCHVGYDFIGYYERFDEDTDFLLNTMQLDKVVRFPSKQSYYSGLTAEEKLQYINKVPKHIMKRLEMKFRKDYWYFGYRTDLSNFPNVTF